MNDRKSAVVGIVSSAPSQSWHVVRMTFEAVVAETSRARPLCEERTVLLRAADERDALQRARKYAKTEEHAYLNASGESVRWTFVGISSISTVFDDPAADHWEIESRFVARARSTLDLIRRQSKSRTR
jgi:hypothetical protein